MEGLIGEFILRISPLMNEYGAWGVFFISLIEEIVVPLPSSFVLLAAGFFLVPAGASFGGAALDSVLKIAIPGGIGLTIGSGVIYALAYLGGEPAIERWGKWFGISWPKVEKIQKKFTKTFWDELLVFGFRAVPIFPQSLASLACGLIRYPPRAFFTATLLGTIARAFLMGMFGWSLGEAYVEYSNEIGNIGWWIAAGTVALSAGFIAYLILKKRKVL